MRVLFSIALVLAACGDDARPDAATPPGDGQVPVFDAAVVDASSRPVDAAGIDGSPAPPDARVEPPDAMPPDANTDLVDHVHIYIDNFCQVTVDPTSYDVPAGSTLQLDYHNHSVDYEADVWLSYGGGYLDLALGDTWNDAFTHCSGPNPSTAYADISIAGGPSPGCPGFRLLINCL